MNSMSFTRCLRVFSTVATTVDWLQTRMTFFSTAITRKAHRYNAWKSWCINSEYCFCSLTYVRKKKGVLKREGVEKEGVEGNGEGWILGVEHGRPLFHLYPNSACELQAHPNWIGWYPTRRQMISDMDCRLRSVRQYKTDFWQYITCNLLFTLNIEMNMSVAVQCTVL